MTAFLIVALIILFGTGGAVAQPALPVSCGQVPCALITVGSAAVPDDDVAREATTLSAAFRWTPLRQGHLVTPEPRDIEPFTHMLLKARSIYGDQERELSVRADEVRRMLLAEFFEALPSIAHWQDHELQAVFAKLCDQLLAVTPRTEQTAIANVCLVHLPDLRAQVAGGKAASAFKPIYLRALEKRARGHIELSTNPGCEIAVGGLRTPASSSFLSDPLPGLYNVVVYCGRDAVLFRIDAHADLGDGAQELHLAALARSHLREQVSQIPHLQFETGARDEMRRAAREIISENTLDAVVLVYMEQDAPVVELVRKDSAVRLQLTESQVYATNPPVTDDRPPTGKTETVSRRKSGPIVLGSIAATGTIAAWSLVLWSGQGPTQRFIDSIDDESVTQPQYDKLEARWRRIRIGLHAAGAMGALAGSAALLLGTKALGDAPQWVHWSSALLGTALAGYGVLKIVLTPACNGADPRPCADELYQKDLGALLVFTATPLLVDALVARPWRPRAVFGRAQGVTSLTLNWTL